MCDYSLGTFLTPRAGPAPSDQGMEQLLSCSAEFQALLCLPGVSEEQ